MTRVLVAAASALTRAGLQTVLRAEPDFQVVATLASGLEPGDGLELADTLGPEADVVVLEQLSERVPPSALALAADPPARAPALVILADVLPARAADWLRAGARAVLPHHATPEEIVAAVRAAAAGLVSLPQAIAAELLEERPARTRIAPAAAAPTALTPRETEVLAMLAEGLGNKTIARRMGISEHTIKTHVAALLQKLGASTRTEAVAIGVRRGLLVL